MIWTIVALYLFVLIGFAAVAKNQANLMTILSAILDSQAGILRSLDALDKRMSKLEDKVKHLDRMSRGRRL